jgi:uncharacterized protein YeaC (DUF1315 family)
MKYLILAAFAANLAVVPAMAETPGNAMKAENSTKMESHGKMTDGTAMSGEKKDSMAMKPMAMKKADKKPQDKTMGATSGDMPMKTDKDMKH